MRLERGFHPLTIGLVGAGVLITTMPGFAGPQLDRSTGSLSPGGKLVSPSAQVDGRFGVATAIHDSTVVIGASLEDSAGADSGRAYVFERFDNGTPLNRSDDSWVLVTALPPTLAGLSAGIEFGSDVAVAADTIAVGVRGSTVGSASSAGAVQLYYRSCGGPGWVAGPLVSAPTPSAGSYFGSSVALDGTTLVVGEPYNSSAGPETGAIYVFTRDDAGTPAIACDDDWIAAQSFNGVAGSLFGFDIALSLSSMVVGAPHTQHQTPGGATIRYAGAAHVFTRNPAGSWTPVPPTLTSSNATALDEFGISVAIHAQRIGVGVYGSDVAGPDAGALHTFVSSGGGWSPESVLSAPTQLASAGAHYGRAIAFYGSLVVAGAPKFDFTNGTVIGTALVHEFVPGIGWTFVEQISPADAIGGDELFGHAVSSDGSRVLIGAYQADELGFDSSGAAYVYELDPTQNFQTFCYGDGGGLSCPCGNASAVFRRQGCANAWHAATASLGAAASASGSDSSFLNDLLIHAHNLRPNGVALLISSPTIGSSQTLSDGVLCIGPAPLKRRGAKLAGFDGTAIWGPNLSSFGALAAGTAHGFQVWYRDPVGGPCGTGANLTNAVQVTFTP